MATTTNYGWTTPDDTALVKDGAAAIRTLGSSIDTSLNTALGTKKAGLVLLNTTSFSGVSSASLPAGTFTSTYNNYRIIADLNCSADADCLLRVRASGTDLTTVTYYWGRYFVGAYVGITAGSGDNLNQSSINIGSINTTTGVGGNFDMEIHAPMLATRTSIKSWNVGNAFSVNGGIVNNTTAYDSLTFFVAGQTISGTIRAYGYQN